MLQKLYCAVCQCESDHEEKFCPSLKCNACTQMGHGKPDCPFKPDNLWQPKPWKNFAIKKPMPKLEVPRSNCAGDPRIKDEIAS